MKQSRLMSLVEALANVIVGYGVAVVTQMLIFPIFGLRTTQEKNICDAGRDAQGSAKKTDASTLAW